jgi:hypothetical protein
MKTMLKPPAINLLTLKYDEPLSSLGFKFNVHRYSTDAIANAITSAATSAAARALRSAGGQSGGGYAKAE